MFEITPFVTVIIPSFNYGEFLSRAIESVLNQDYSGKIEIIVIDDGSTDNTKEEAEKYLGRIRYLYQENGGKASATRLGIAAANGKYLFNLDADDWFLKNKITTMVSLFENNSLLECVAHASISRSSGSKETPENIPQAICDHPINGSTMIKTELLGGYFYGGGSTFGAKTETLKKIRLSDQAGIFVDEYLFMAVLSLGGFAQIQHTPFSVRWVHTKNYSLNQSSALNKDRQLIKDIEGVAKLVKSLPLSDEIKQLYNFKSETRRTYVLSRSRVLKFKELAVLLQKLLQTKKYITVIFFRYRVHLLLIPFSIKKEIKKFGFFMISFYTQNNRRNDAGPKKPRLKK